MEEKLDVIIIGGGASGLTAALFAARRGLKTIVVSQDIGGQAATTALVENYPGVDPIDGLVLMERFQKQAETAGAKIVMDEVQTIKKPDEQFIVHGVNHTYRSWAVIVAYGLTHRHLDVPGENQLIGKGVTYCATCDAPLFKKKNVAVIGGGNSAMDAALLLANLDATVSVLTVNTEFHGERVLIERLQASPRITTFTNAHVTEILGRDQVSGMKFTHDDQVKELSVEGIFVEIGFTVKPELIRGLTELDQRNQIIMHPADNSTSVPGLFAAGDVTTIPQKQIVISAGEGAKAALGVYQYLQSTKHIPLGGKVDWGVQTPLRHEKS